MGEDPGKSSSKKKSLANLRNRTGEGRRRRQTLCDKRDNNFGWNNFSFKRIFL